MQSSHPLLRGLASIAVSSLLLAGCATMPPLPPQEVADPREDFNRGVNSFNEGFNTVVTGPIALAYTTVVPGPVREGIRNGINNMNEPIVFANDLLQGRGDSAGKTFGRFIINSSFGLGGLIDVANYLGVPRQTGDFGQTLYKWGYYDTSYIVIPFFGPTTVRDGIGYGIDSIANPVSYGISEYSRIAPFAIGAFSAVLRTTDLVDLRESSVDSYARLRSVYWQQRRSDLLDAIGRKNDVFDPMLGRGGDAATAPAGARPTPARARQTTGHQASRKQVGKTKLVRTKAPTPKPAEKAAALTQ